MNNKQKQALAQIKMLFDSQKFAVLSTQKDHQPYASLVAFTATNSFDQILFLTPKTTRKYDNLTNNPKVALLINNHQNNSDDIYNAVCVTATGTAITVENQQKDDFLDLFTGQHPQLKAFSTDPATALVCVLVDTFFVVSEFQDVVTIRVFP
jgi:nitroimidazol reductase NimA-like FMN-containing flavoprotein (pyridoxamine 5'-phosphate oxidase superfamily)